MASSSVLNRKSGATGPNVSSRATIIAGVTSASTVGSKKRPPQRVTLAADARPSRPCVIASAMCSSTFATALSSMSGPCVAPASRPGAGFSFSTAVGQLLRERVVDAVLHVDAVHAHAGLAGVAVLRRHRALDRRIQIRIVEHDERRVAAELERQLLHRARALRHQQLADLGRSGERQLLHDRIRRQLAANLGGRSGDDVEDALRDAGALGELGERQRRERRLRRRLEHDGAAGRDRRTGLARDHRQREVPRRDAGHDANRLLDDDDALVGLVAGNGVAVDALGFFAEPLEERRGVDHLALRLGERLALLGRHQPRQVLLVLRASARTSVRTARGALLRGLLAPGGQRAIRGLDRRPRLGGAELRHGADRLRRSPGCPP